MSKKTLRKRIISMVLVLVMLIGCTGMVQAEETHAGGMVVALRFEAYGYMKLYPVNITLPETYRSLDGALEERGYGLDLGTLADPGYYTPLHAMAQYCLDQGKIPSEEIVLDMKYDSLNVKDYLHTVTPETFLMFSINYQSDGSVLGSYRLSDSDEIMLADWYWSVDSDVVYFEQAAYEAEANQAFGVKLNGMKDAWSAYEGDRAQIQVLDEKGAEINNAGQQVYEAGITGADGQASVCIKEPGSYILAAERKNANGYHEINRGYAKVSVTEEQELADQKAVEKAVQELSLGDISAITSDITLPAAGAYGTAIEWKSSSPALIDEWGRVTRPCDENPQVTLSAAVSKGAARIEKEFLATVKGFSLELKALSVSPGTLSFERDKRAYTVYVPDGTKEVEVTCATEENDIVFINNKLKMDATTPQTESVAVENGTVITLNVKNASFQKEKLTHITIKYGNPAEPLPGLPNEWGQYLGNDQNNAVTSAPAPKEDAGLAWKSKTESASGFSTSGTPLLVNGQIYVARNDELQILDAQNGQVIKSAKLYTGLAWYSYMAYGDGKIFVPLGNGSVQCFNAATLESLFITEIPLLGMQGISAIYYKDNRIYVGVTNGGEPEKSKGAYAAYETTDLFKEQSDEIISPLWIQKGSGFYGTGAVSVEKNGATYVLIAGDDGIVQCMNSADGSVISSAALEGAVRSPLVVDSGYLFTATKAGKLYKLSLSEAGELSIAASTPLLQATTNAPVISGGKVYVTGGEGKKGYFSVFDMELRKLESVQTEGRMNAPVVVTAYSDTYVFFTEYNAPGGLYMATVSGNNKISLERLFLPDEQNYCMSNVVIGSDGTIYFGNDSGYLFAVKSGGKKPEESKPGTGGAGGSGNAKEPEAERIRKQSLLSAVAFSPVKQPMLVSAKKKETENTVNLASETIAAAIAEKISGQKSTLTVKNVPEVIGSAVFKELVKHPEFKLVLDCGGYTISIQGKDVTDAEASLSTKIAEKDRVSIKEEEESQQKLVKQLGSYQLFELAQEGTLPGKLTVVYPLPKKLEPAEEVYFYKRENLAQPEDTILQNKYVMFAIRDKGEFLLSNKSTLKPAVQSKKETTKESAVTLSSTKKAAGSKVPDWMQLVLVGVTGLAVGGILTGTVLTRKRRKERTWER